MLYFTHHHTKKSYDASAKSARAFTLIELMVSIAIFGIIVTVGIGSVVSVTQAHRNALAQQASIDTVSFVFESMARQIRTGDNYACLSSVGNEWCEGISFNDQERERESIEYRYQDNNIIIEREDNTSFSLVSDADDVRVSGARFRLACTGISDDCQPRVSIHAEIDIRGGEDTMYVQTTVTQRALGAADTNE